MGSARLIRVLPFLEVTIDNLVIMLLAVVIMSVFHIEALPKLGM